MLKKLMPHIIAVLSFAVVTVIYFLPYYQGLTLSQGDVHQWEGVSKEIVDWNKAHPDDPALWTGRVFSGMPAVQISLSYPGNLVGGIIHALSAIFPYSACVIFLTILGFYIMLLCFEVDPWLSMAGALGYGLSSFIFISIDAGHNTKVQAMSLMAPVLGGVVLAYRKNILIGAALTALFLSMAIDSNHLQISYYIILMLGILGVYYFVTSILEKRISHFFKATGALVIAGVLAILPNIGNLWSTQEYGTETIRGGSSELTQKKEATKGGGLDFEYATRWSYGVWDGEFLSVLIPDIKGGGGSNTLSNDTKIIKRFEAVGYPVDQGLKKYVASLLYWGSQPFTSGPVYFGAILVFLFVFGMLVVRSSVKWTLLIITIMSFLFAFGNYTFFYKLMFNFLPFFNKFRTPSMALVIAELTIPLIAMLGVNELLNGQTAREDLLKKLKISAGITLGVIVIFGILGNFRYAFSGPNDIELAKSGLMKNIPDLMEVLRSERSSMLLSDSFRSIFFIAVSAVLLWFFIQNKLSRSVFVLALALGILVDNGLVAKRYLNNDNFVEKKDDENTHQATQADMDILRDPDPNYRVYNIAGDRFNDAQTSYYHKSIGGYHAAKLIRYQDLIENQLYKNNINVLNMLNTKYVIVKNEQTQQLVAQRNPDALGNVWFVHNIKWVKNADEEMAALDNFNPKETVVIDETKYKSMVPADAIGSDAMSTIKETLYSPNKLEYEYQSGSSQLAVFSEIYYNDHKGWDAYLDGKPVPHFRVNYVLRAMALPAGTHKIEFKFEPRSVVTGNKIAYAGSFLLFIFVIGTFGFGGYKKMKEIEAEPETPKVEAKTTTAKVQKPNKKK